MIEVNKLYNMDCYDFIKTLPDNCIDLIITDPPYEISVSNGGGTVNSKMKLKQKLKPIEDLNIHLGYDIEKINTELVRIMKRINIYIWCNKNQIPAYIDFYVNKLKCKFEILTWHKTNPLPTYSNKYLTDTEYCLYFRKNGFCNPESYEFAKTYYLSPLNQKDKIKYEHPTIKPLEWIVKFIKNSSKIGDVVFDPFIGSGTTATACVMQNRKYLGCEINPKYYEIAKQRISELEDEDQDFLIKPCRQLELF